MIFCSAWFNFQQYKASGPGLAGESSTRLVCSLWRVCAPVRVLKYLLRVYEHTVFLSSTSSLYAPRPCCRSLTIADFLPSFFLFPAPGSQKNTLNFLFLPKQKKTEWTWLVSPRESNRQSRQWNTLANLIATVLRTTLRSKLILTRASHTYPFII